MVGELVTPLNSVNVSWLGIVMNASGLVGSTALSIILRFTANLDLICSIRMCIVGVSTAYCSMILVLWYCDYDTHWPVYLTNVLLGSTLVPLFFLSYELASHQTKKLGVGEATSCGIINMMACGLTTTVWLCLTPIVGKETPKRSLITFLIILALQMISVVLIFIIKNK